MRDQSGEPGPRSPRRAGSRLHSALRWLGALTGGRPWVGPAQVQLGLSDACDGHCVFCRYASGTTWRPSSTPLMSLELAEAILTALVRAGVASLEVCGRGEPLLNRACVDVLATARGLGLATSLVTNGRHLLRHDLARLVRLDPQYVNVSLDGGTEDSYEALHRGAAAGTWQAVVEGVRALVQAKQEAHNQTTEVTLSLAVCGPTAEDPERMARIAADVGATGILLFPTALYQGMDDLALGDRREAAVASARCAAALAEQAGLSHNVGRFLAMMAVTDPHRHAREIVRRVPCYAGHFFAQIGAGGEVYPCCACDMLVGRTEGGDWEAVWGSEKYHEFRRAARNLPRAGQPDFACYCESCFYAWTNLRIHRRLRPWAKASAAEGPGEP